MKTIKKIFLLGSLSLLLFSCTKRFDDINKNDAKIADIGEQEIPFLFSKALQIGAPYSYQTYQNLYADLYAQYFATTSTGFQTDRYTIRFDWLDNNWRNQYTGFMPQLKTIFEKTDPHSGEYAIASIWWVYGFSHLTDYFGPIPYSKAGEDSGGEIPYDSQEAIYNDFFKRLKEAVAVLKNSGKTNIYGSYDLIYNGAVSQWITFANTLRLRLALRISKVNPALAKTEAEAAVADGVMTTVADDATMLKSSTGNDYNPLAHIAVWNEFSMSSSMLSYLKGYGDPRISKYFQPVVGTSKYASLRNGQPNVDLNNKANQPSSLSQIGTEWVTWSGTGWVEHQNRRQDIMHAAEAYFLRAEGALNGWNMGGGAQELYEKGITTSFQQWGITDQAVIDHYIHSDSLPVAPEDFQNSGPVSTTPVKWSPDINIERAQIGTQKWLALYPDGFEAWAEVRRSGYPILYPVVQSDNPNLPVGTTIKRIPYPTVEQQTNADALQKGISLLKGPDNAATRLWWDVD